MAEAEATRDTGSAATTLSQLVARILQQLSLSAWLPSAALTLLVAFIFQLGSVLDTPVPSGKPHTKPTYITSPGAALSKAFEDLSQTSFGGLLLLVSIVVVLTLLTQAFSFESIRIMEGYWGTSRIMERLARRRCRHHQETRRELEDSLADLTKAAWATADQEIEARQDALLARGKPVVWTPNMRSALGARALRKQVVVPITDPAEKKRVNGADWKSFADPELLRRRINIQARLRDYPEKARILPTRLGNVIRHYEDKSGRVEVENLVDAVFDSLPFNLRLSHDEQRSRLDLYCSMVFVLTTVAAVAVARFWLTHWGYSVASVVICALGSVFSYRAAIASARAYGPLLVRIADYPSGGSTGGS